MASKTFRLDRPKQAAYQDNADMLGPNIDRELASGKTGRADRSQIDHQAIVDAIAKVSASRALSRMGNSVPNEKARSGLRDAINAKIKKAK